MNKATCEDLQRLFDLSVDMMCVVDNTTIQVVNPALIAWLGFTAEEFLGGPLLKLVHPEDREGAAKQMELLFRGETTVSFEMRVQTASGEYRWSQWSARADSPTGRVYAVGRDITNQRAANNKLQEYTEMLERAQRELKQALDELNRVANTDPLTELLNRRGFESRADEELSRSERHGRPIGLALFDIDHFKRINDEHGHPVGDVVLREVARRMQAGSRQHDMVARWGGEEFVALFPETTLEEAKLAAERVALSVSARPFVLGSAVISVHVSGGVTAGNGSETDSLFDLVSAADAALLRAKRNGRDRIEFEEQKNFKKAG